MRELDPGASPMHFFGAEVRHARIAAGMTQSELGTILGYDASEVSKVEGGAAPSEKFAEGCDKAFPSMNGWFTRFYQEAHKWDGPYPRWFLDWVKAEREALTLRMWQVELVPGLLQTADYARELFRAWQPASADDELDGLVNSRLERQAILDKPDPPELWVVLDESVLHRLIGSAKTMSDQLEHLMDMSARPSVAVQVVPAGSGAHAGLLGAFALAAVDGSPDILYLDTAVQGQTVIETALVRKAASVFNRLHADALPRAASRDLIGKVANERWTTQ
jgi:transcriptional regulator with XRE-family HTH domain